MIKTRTVSLFVLLAAGVAVTQGANLWKESTYEDFGRGTAKGVAIRSTGSLELAPAFKLIYTSPSTFIWSIAADKEGNIYAATGAPGRVYRVTPDGKSSVIFEPKELQVQSVALGGDGAIYAATSPDGKVYRLTRGSGKPAAEFTSSVFYDPKTKYIWDLAFDGEGRLYVATGDRAEIHRVDKNGQGSVFFKSDEGHIRTLALDPKGNVIAGSDGSGLIYRIAPNGEGFVLYSAPRKEIVALAVDASGNIFASGTGEKSTAPATPATSAPAPQASPSPVVTIGSVNLSGSDVYMISPDGSPKRLWTSHEDIVYALAFDAGGRLIAGTGNKGRIYSIENNGDFTRLLQASANQVTAFSKAPGGGIYCSSSNLGKVFLLSNAPEAEGTFDSDVKDARNFSRWGRAEVRGRGNFELFARSGNVDNPDRNWSAWTRVDETKDWRLDVPSARFVQWRAVLKPDRAQTQIEEVGINFLAKNVAPVVDDIAVHVGARFLPVAHNSGGEGITVGFGPPAQPTPRFDPTPSAIRDRGFVAVRWAAHDENDDDLVYSVYYRGERERDWKLLKSGLTDKFYSFESGLLPDGNYFVRVVASDAPSHTPEDALTGERQSTYFELDNTPPRIDNLAAKVEGQRMRVTFSATDAVSPIKRAEYSIDAGDWQYLEPVGQISDSRSEKYDFGVPLSSLRGVDDQPESKKLSKAGSTEHVVVVRVYDRYDNAATAKYVTP